MRGICLFLLVTSTFGNLFGQKLAADPRAEIEAFNKRLADATKSMSNSELLKLWAEDGVSLLPSTEPMVGKAAIAAFLTRVTAPLQGARMEKFEMQCSSIEVSGNWASEWCDEHQVVVLAGGKPPFDGRGRMLFVLRKDADGNWLIEREMWNQA